MRRIWIFTLFICFSLPVRASFLETFGASAENMGLANQFSFSNEASNNYYAPALLGFKRQTEISFGTSVVETDFNPIQNIVTKNPTNNSDSPLTQEGPVSTNYSRYYALTFNAALPIKDLGTLGLTVTSPIGDFLEFNTGDPFLPEYVMYRARFRRTQVFLNYAHRLSSLWSMALGTHIGLQTGTRSDIRAALNGTGYGSAAELEGRTSPSLGLLASFAKRWSKGTRGQVSFVSYQQEMKGNLTADSTGFTADPPVPFDITLTSMLYYDPHIFRLGHGYKGDFIDIQGTLEHQLWHNYQTPVIRIRDNGGALTPSDNYENVEPENIWVPRIGLKLKAFSPWEINFGAAYRPTPLESDFSDSGNSIDADSLIFTTGVDYSTELWDVPIGFHTAFQYHHLLEKNVKKSDGLENGNSGRKIGDPGYKIGGQVMMLSLGAHMTF